MKSIYPGALFSMRNSPDNISRVLTTRNGNYLIDCHFPSWPDPELVQNHIRGIVGVVEISLFYNLVNTAIIAGRNGIDGYFKKNGAVSLLSRKPLNLT